MGLVSSTRRKSDAAQIQDRLEGIGFKIASFHGNGGLLVKIEQRVLMVGLPAAGKTSVLLQLAQMQVDNPLSPGNVTYCINVA